MRPASSVRVVAAGPSERVGKLLRESLGVPPAPGCLGVVGAATSVREGPAPELLASDVGADAVELRWQVHGRPTVLRLGADDPREAWDELLAGIRAAVPSEDPVSALDQAFDPMGPARRLASCATQWITEAEGATEIYSPTRRTKPRLMPRELAHTFAARLLHRIFVILFLQDKGWLRWDGRADYLTALFEDWSQRPGHYRFHQLLALAMFSGLNQPSAAARSMVRRLVGDLPYIGPSLFDPRPFESAFGDERGVARLPEALFERMLAPGGTARRFRPRFADLGPEADEVGATVEAVGFALDEALAGRPAEPPHALRAQARSLLEAEVGPLGASPEKVLAEFRSLRLDFPDCGSGALVAAVVREATALWCGALRELGQPEEPGDVARRFVAECLCARDEDEINVDRARARVALAVLEFDGEAPPRPLPDIRAAVRQGRTVVTKAPQPPVEDERNEFKAGFSWNRRKGEEDPRMKAGFLRTVVGFLNTGGGTIWLGYDDQGLAVGLEEELARIRDTNPRDVFQLRIHEALKNAVEPLPVGAVEWEWQIVGAATVAKVHVRACPVVNYLLERDASGRTVENVYVRDGARTIALVGRHRDAFVVSRANST